MNLFYKFTALFLFFFLILSNEVYPNSDLKEAIENVHRNKNNTVRDQYRKPYETLSFFGLKKGMKVLEISQEMDGILKYYQSFLKILIVIMYQKYKVPPVKVVGENQKSLMNILVLIKISLEELNQFFLMTKIYLNQG